jgi:CYTH domain-containing protein
MYLTADEYELLARLPAASLRKRRLSMPPLGVDLFEGVLAGLVLAEAEFADDEAVTRFAPPSWAVADVTTDQRFTGGHLAVGSSRIAFGRCVAECESCRTTTRGALPSEGRPLLCRPDEFS